MKVVTGTFHDGKKVAGALDALIDASVPVEDIHVIVESPRGEQEVPIEERTRGLAGALIGAGIGAVMGIVGAVLIETEVLSSSGIGLDSEAFAFSLLRYVLVGVALGGGVGLFAGLDFRKERADLRRTGLAHGKALIAVESDDLHDEAKRILERAGADSVAG
jgi:hypothetical protein